MQRWRHLFRSENDVADRFVEHLERLNTLVENLGGEHADAVEAIQSARKQFRVWSDKPERMFTNVFLAPAVHAARSLAQAAESAGRHADALWICNVFGEMAKILVARTRDAFLEYFEDLLLTACDATAGLWLKEVAGKETEDEINTLRSRMQIVCKDALGTFFQARERRFFPSNRPEIAMGEWAMGEALAAHFDRRLLHLLEFDRPHVKDYVRANLPATYRLKMTGDAAVKRRQNWERILCDAGYEDVLRLLKDMGDLINPDEVGVVTPERREDVNRAAANNDLQRVVELLADSAKELKAFLYSEAQLRLRYREPAAPLLADRRLKHRFSRVPQFSKTDDPDNLRKALAIAQEVWQEDINNLALRDWVAYLYAKTGNLPSAEKLLNEVRKRRRDDEADLATDWNLAVLANDRKEGKGAYELLLPLIAKDSFDEDLVIVVLALSLKLDDAKTFLSTIPQTMTLRFHPLAMVVAHNAGNTTRVEEFLGQLLRHWQGKWELPPVTTQFAGQDFDKTINRAIVEGQVEQLITWLRARIKVTKNWFPNYFALARVFEQESQDCGAAFGILEDCYKAAWKRDPRDQGSIDGVCRDLLELCRRCTRPDLGKRAYRLAQDARAPDDLLRSFRSFAPQQPTEQASQQRAETVAAKVEPSVVVATRDPKLAERLAWVTARLAEIRNVNAYVEQTKAIDEFGKIVAEINPQESGAALDLIRSTSGVFETFVRSNPDDHDGRRSLYDRASGFEKRLSHLLRSGAVSQHLTDVLTPYCQVLQQVVGDLSRRAGVGPILEAVIENPFISLGCERSTLVMRVLNKTERAVTDVTIEILIESVELGIVGKREWVIGKMQAHESRVLSIPIEKKILNSEKTERVVFGISLRASAEGFPNVDLGIIKKEIPVKSFAEAVGSASIPKLFQIGQPLRPADPALFQGRTDTLSKIKNSFHGGIQRERYFLDGIRRAGKTSILNFLPGCLPDALMPILVNLDKFGLRGPVDSAGVLRHFCTLIEESFRSRGPTGLAIPDEAAFASAPARVFETFLNECQVLSPDQIPFLMFDEFQKLLEAIATTGSASDRDTVVLDILRGYLEEGKLYAVFTGSVRFDRLSDILDHRIFGSLTRLRVSFLSEESVSGVLRAGMEQWVKLLPETIKTVYELTGGYPWLVQTYGAGLVDLLNRENRTVASPEDVEYVTQDAVLCSNELFSFWWPTEQLGAEEEHFIEWLFRKYPTERELSTRDFFAEIGNRDQAAFRRAFDNLRACEVLDSTQTQQIRFRGSLLRRWLEQQLDGGQLRIRRNTEARSERGQAGMFVDHENLVKSLERISIARGVPVPRDKSDWFASILSHLLEEAKNRLGELTYKRAVAFWSRPEETALLPVYLRYGFTVAQPEEVKMENAVDFKVADEVRRAREQAMREGTQMNKAIVVSGDGDLSHAARALINDGVAVQIWGGSESTSASYVGIVGQGNVIVLDDVCGL